ncbi:MAG: ribose 5-phosphate isomerase B [Ignavibacteria bacterium]|nr:ribose 5-phosphate isomerase B [Ignavibacteria bacterium]
MKIVAIGSDHRGFQLKKKLIEVFSNEYEIIDSGTYSEEPADYPDIASSVANLIISGRAWRGIIICGSGVGASVAANKFKGIRAAVCHDTFSARQGVEDDDMNVLCMGGGIVGELLAVEITRAFLGAEFKKDVERYVRRLEKVKKIEDENG